MTDKDSEGLVAFHSGVHQVPCLNVVSSLNA